MKKEKSKKMTEDYVRLLAEVRAELDEMQHEGSRRRNDVGRWELHLLEAIDELEDARLFHATEPTTLPLRRRDESWSSTRLVEWRERPSRQQEARARPQIWLIRRSGPQGLQADYRLQVDFRLRAALTRCVRARLRTGASKVWRMRHSPPSSHAESSSSRNTRSIDRQTSFVLSPPALPDPLTLLLSQ